MWGPVRSGFNVRTTLLCCWWGSHVRYWWTWVIYNNNVLSIKTILFDILDFWCQSEVIRFVKTLSKRHMFVSFMKISACWLLHRLIKFNKICWEKTTAANLVSFDLKGGPEPLEKESHEFLGSKRDDRFSNPFFWNGTRNMSRFVFLTCFGMIISVRARGHCESSRRSARR